MSKERGYDAIRWLLAKCQMDEQEIANNDFMGKNRRAKLIAQNKRDRKRLKELRQELKERKQNGK